MNILLLLYGLSVISTYSSIKVYRYNRIKDIGKNGYKINMNKLGELYNELPDIKNSLVYFIPLYNIIKTDNVITEYRVFKEDLFDILKNKNIIKNMRDDEYTEYRSDEKFMKMIEISDRTDEQSTFLGNVQEYIYDFYNEKNILNNKKVLSFNLEDDEDSHFDVYYDNENNDFVLLENEGLFNDLDNNTRNLFCAYITKFLNELYNHFDFYKDKIGINNNSISINVESFDFNIKIKDLYEYVPDNMISNNIEERIKTLKK